MAINTAIENDENKENIHRNTITLENLGYIKKNLNLMKLGIKYSHDILTKKIRLSFAKNNLYMEIRNNHMHIISSFNLISSQDSKPILVDFTHFFKIFKTIGAKVREIHMTIFNNKLEIVKNNSRTYLLAINENSNRNSDSIMDQVITINSKILITYVKAISISLKKEAHAYALIHIENQEMRFVFASNRRISFSDPLNKLNHYLPDGIYRFNHNTLKILIGLMDINDIIQIGLSNKNIIFKGDHSTIKIPLINMNSVFYKKYKDMISENICYEFDRLDLKGSLDQVSALCDHRNMIKFLPHEHKNSSVISCYNPTAGKSIVEIAILNDKKISRPMHFNSEILLDTISTLRDSERILMYIHDVNSTMPIVLRGSQSFATHVIAPIFLNKSSSR